jgi:HK97 family phage portal protein
MKVLTATGAYAEVHAAQATSGFLEGGTVGGGVIELVSASDQLRRITYSGVYKTNPWVWACVHAKARGLARFPLHVFEFDDDGNRTRVRSDLPQRTSGPLTAGQQLDALLRQPDPERSRQASVRGAVTSRLVHGNAAWEIVRERGRISALKPHPWATGIRWVDDHYEVNPTGWGGERRRLSPDDVIHFGRGEDPESLVAPSPIGALSATLALYDAIARHLQAYFRHQARPSGHLKVPTGLSDDDQRRIREAVMLLYAGPDNAGKVAITSGEWTSITAEPEHTRVVELAKASREEVMAVYDIPPPMVGVLERAIFSNVKELRSYWTRDVVGAEASNFEAELMAQLLTRQRSWSSNFVEFALAEHLRPDIEARADTYEKLRRVLTIDEIRALENRKPLNIRGVTDVPLLPAGEMPAAGPQTPEEDDDAA